MEKLKEKICKIAEKYADAVEKHLSCALQKSEIDSIAMTEIGDSIRILNHVVNALERIERIERMGHE